MLFFATLFLVFLYFKLARVHKKEEKLSTATYIFHALVAISAIVLYIYGFKNFTLLTTLLLSFIFFIVAALMVTAVQVGIFVDGKPFVGMSQLYKAMPYLAGVIALFAFITFVS